MLAEDGGGGEGFHGGDVSGAGEDDVRNALLRTLQAEPDDADRTAACRADAILAGRRAGPVRNRQMLAHGADAVYAFRLPGHSPGTDDMVRIARNAGVPVVLVHPGDRTSSETGGSLERSGYHG